MDSIFNRTLRFQKAPLSGTTSFTGADTVNHYKCCRFLYPIKPVLGGLDASVYLDRYTSSRQVGFHPCIDQTQLGVRQLSVVDGRKVLMLWPIWV